MIKTVVFGGEHKDYLRDLQDSPDIFYADCKTSPIHYRRNGNGKYLSKRFIPFAPGWLLKRVYKKIFGWDFFEKIEKGDTVLCLFCSHFALYDDYIFPDFIASLKRIMPKSSKYAFFSYDLFGRHTIERDNLKALKNSFDLMLTFCKTDAEKYDLIYYGSINSRVPDEELTEAPESDIFYCGGDAGRFEIQTKVFKNISDFSFRCLFYINGVSEENISKLPGLIKGIKRTDNNIWKYKNSSLIINSPLYYLENASHIAKCKCIAEFLVGESSDATMRFPESVIYRKKLLTNNKNVNKHPAYSKNNIMIFDNPDNIDKNAFFDFINSPYEEVDYDFSPLKMVKYVKEKLFKEV